MDSIHFTQCNINLSRYRLSVRYLISLSRSRDICSFFGSQSKAQKIKSYLPMDRVHGAFYMRCIMIVIIVILGTSDSAFEWAPTCMLYPSQCWYYYNNGY